jgi:hypothetical protein
MSSGFYDANGVYQYGESDPIALFSATLNKGMDSVSDAIGLDRTRLTTLETKTTDTWISFTPTLNSWVLGNGTIAGRYFRVGKTVLVKFELTIGSTTSYTTTATSFGISGAPSISWGLTSSSQVPLGTGTLEDGTVRYPLVPYYNSASSFRVNVLNAASTYATYTQISNSVPATLAAGDRIIINLMYETT